MIIAHVFLIYALKVISREEPIDDVLVQNLPICEERYDYRIPAPSSELGLRLIDDKFLKIKYSFNNIPRVKDSANNPINYRYLHLLLKVDDQRIKSRKLEVGSEYDDFDLKISLPKNFKGEFSVISFYEDEENWISPKREDLFTVSADIGELMAIKIVKKSIEPNDELSIVNKRRTEDVIFKFETMSEVPEQPKIEEIKVDVSAPTLGYEFSKWSEADSFNNFKCDIPICTPVTLTFTPSFKSRSKLGQRSQMETLLLPDIGLIGTVFVVMFKIYRRETLMDLETERVTLRTRVTEEGRADMTNKSIIDHLMSKDNIKTAEISK
ncbi:MAG: hypothetical protein MHPSP_002367 [Paramarteilia canceri]